MNYWQVVGKEVLKDVSGGDLIHGTKLFIEEVIQHQRREKIKGQEEQLSANEHGK